MSHVIKNMQEILDNRDYWQAEHQRAMAELKTAKAKADAYLKQFVILETELSEARKESEKFKETLAGLAHHPQPVMPMLSKAEIHANTALNSLLLREDLISANRLLAGHKDDINLIIERAKDIGARMAETI